MAEQTFERGDEVVVKTNRKKLYTFISYIDADTASCADSNGKKVKLSTLVLEKYQTPSPGDIFVF